MRCARGVQQTREDVDDLAEVVEQIARHRALIDRFCGDDRGDHGQRRARDRSERHVGYEQRGGLAVVAVVATDQEVGVVERAWRPFGGGDTAAEEVDEEVAHRPL